jgi:hypothetical protein
MPIGTRISKSRMAKRQYGNKSEVYIIEVMTKAVTRNTIICILLYLWARPDFIIGVSKSKMECVNPIAMITAKHSLCLWLRRSVFKFTRHMWKATIDEECGNYSE